jgi:hypothetical protein
VALVSKAYKPQRRSRFIPDVKAAESVLGLKIKVGIDEAIKKTLLWHKAAVG